MLRETLRLQWRATRWTLLPFLLFTLGLPLLVLRLASQLNGDADSALGLMELWAPLFPLLAAVLGSMVGLSAWSWDHHTGHVYALSLPLSRARYATYRFLAGVAVLLVPVLVLLAGAVVGSAFATLPATVHAYPVSFTVRFLVGALITYAVCFALAAGTVRTVIWLALGTMLVLALGTVFLPLLESALGTDLISPLELLERALVEWPGPFHVFGGSWMLIDA